VHARAEVRKPQVRGTNGRVGRAREVDLPAERRATLLDRADPLLRIEPEVAVGDHAGGFLERRLGLLDQETGATRGSTYLRPARVQGGGTGRVTVCEAPAATETNSMPPDLRAPASAASSSSGASVWASSAIRSQREAGDRRGTARIV
jgi:hypothetical protein